MKSHQIGFYSSLLLFFFSFLCFLFFCFFSFFSFFFFFLSEERDDSLDEETAAQISKLYEARPARLE